MPSAMLSPSIRHDIVTFRYGKRVEEKRIDGPKGKGGKMGVEFDPMAFNPGFHHLGIGAKVGTRKDPAMVPIVEPKNNANEMAANASERPHASDWLWRPWHAKLWWVAIAAYWAGKIGSFYSPALDDFYTSALAGLLNVAFFPPLALVVLGLGFARAWFAWSDWEVVETTHEDLFRRPLIDPYSDPSNPLSGSIYRRHHRH